MYINTNGNSFYLLPIDERDLKEDKKTTPTKLLSKTETETETERARLGGEKKEVSTLSLSLALSHSQHCAVDVSDAFTRNTRNKRLGEN